MRWADSSMDDDTEYAITEALALTDTGASCIIGPSDQLRPIMNTILNTSNSVKIDQIGWSFSFDCEDASDMPAFELLFGGYWFEVRPEDYVIEIATDECSVCMSPYDNINAWILGSAFMRGWYNIHKYETKQMGFVPYDGSLKSTLTDTLP